MAGFTDHDDVERASPITMTPDESARISAELAEFDTISRLEFTQNLEKV